MNDSNVFNGIITRSVGGLYYVETAIGVLCCKARGIFRNKDISPFTGDRVEVIVEENAEPVIDKILERKNELIRPPLANLDCVLLVVSSCKPSPNPFVIDKLICVFESKSIETVLIFTKNDIKDSGFLSDIYQKIGYRCFTVDNISGSGADSVRQFATGKVCALIGNSGVGKSSLMNRIFPELESKTGEISEKLGRGRHTTREVIMFALGGGYIADTPGFSTVDVEKYCRIPKEELRFYFREFEPYLGRCRFNDCMHLKEAGCAVTEAVGAVISRSRYDSYVRMYEEAAQREKKYPQL